MKRVVCGCQSWVCATPEAVRILAETAHHDACPCRPVVPDPPKRRKWAYRRARLAILRRRKSKRVMMNKICFVKDGEVVVAVCVAGWTVRDEVAFRELVGGQGGVAR